MLTSLFTLDYEIHGNGDGCPRELMIEPTDRMMDQFERYGAKLTIMADVAEILKFREYRDTTGRDDYHYEAIAEQLRAAIRRGHDVQLHLHASYINARHEGGRWLQDWADYNFAELPLERLEKLVRLGKDYLEQLLKPVRPEYRCMAFRAANWAVSPSRHVIRALVSNGIEIETSVFKHGRRKGLVSFDYTNAPSELVPWRVDENDICRRDEDGPLTEVPIYCERRWLGAFISVNRVYRAHLSRKHVVRDPGRTPPAGSQSGQGLRGRILRAVRLALGRHAWKADFNQCSGRQLVAALQRAEARYGSPTSRLPFVLIGHSKLFTRHNEKSLAPFLAFVADRKDRFGFGTFHDFSPARVSTESAPGAAPATRQSASI